MWVSYGQSIAGFWFIHSDSLMICIKSFIFIVLTNIARLTAKIFATIFC